MNIYIENTADGSVTLYRQDLEEHYHSIKGALGESRHVYIELGLRHYIDENRKSIKSGIRIFEVGFGTGLNAALAAALANTERIPTEYFAIELFPLSSDVYEQLFKFQGNEYSREFIMVNRADWDKPIKINDFFTLHKIKQDLIKADLPQDLNVVFFDAFAPEKQPEMWDENIFRRIFDAMSPGAVLTTYCAKGRIRRMLQSIGFLAERLPGPPGGKREVLRATKP